jgi:hypothetical protein
MHPDKILSMFEDIHIQRNFLQEGTMDHQVCIVLGPEQVTSTPIMIDRV